MMHDLLRRAALGACLCCSFISLDASAGHSDISPPKEETSGDLALLEVVLHWNTIALEASGVDHTPSRPGEGRLAGEAAGPGRASRALAIVHIAMFDALASIHGGYRSYTGIGRVGTPETVSSKAAVAKAAHDTLVAMFPSQTRIFDRYLEKSLQAIPADSARSYGRMVGSIAARKILELRRHDGSNYVEPSLYDGFTPGDEPGKWRGDPISGINVAVGAYWGKVTPFVLASSKQFRVPPPPALDSAEYAEAYDEVQRLGGDGITTPTERTAEQTFIGVFWGYDGVPVLGTPPSLYNQIAKTIARQMGSDAIQTARLLALVNVSIADAGIAVWESKFHYQFWRPITGIRESDPGTGPTGAGDGNSATTGDPTFVPLGAPASNLNAPNFTPPFPAYPSGHAGFGGALFQILRRFYGTDDIKFTVTSDEYNGLTRDNLGVLRLLHPRTFNSLSQAEEENGQSRIYLGIHWSFDKSEGITQGQQIADYVFDRLYRPK